MQTAKYITTFRRKAACFFWLKESKRSVPPIHQGLHTSWLGLT